MKSVAVLLLLTGLSLALPVEKRSSDAAKILVNALLKPSSHHQRQLTHWPPDSSQASTQSQFYDNIFKAKKYVQAQDLSQLLLKKAMRDLIEGHPAITQSTLKTIPTDETAQAQLFGLLVLVAASNLYKHQTSSIQAVLGPKEGTQNLENLLSERPTTYTALGYKQKTAETQSLGLLLGALAALPHQQTSTAKVMTSTEALNSCIDMILKDSCDQCTVEDYFKVYVSCTATVSGREATKMEHREMSKADLELMQALEKVLKD